MYFKELDYPKFDLLEDFNMLLDTRFIQKNKDNDQYCINTVPGEDDSPNFGRGSLEKDWDKSYYDNETQKIVVPDKPVVYKEEDFTQLVSAFKNTSFEKMYDYLNEKYVLGRVRVMISKPKTCLSWHQDWHNRIHYPMQTQLGCLMVIEDEVKYLEKNKWYFTNTLVSHTAFNASFNDRIHLVATVISDK